MDRLANFPDGESALTNLLRDPFSLMRKTFCLTIVLILSLISYSQTKDSTTYLVVDTLASYPGGESAWRKYLERNFNTTPGIDRIANGGSYKVIVKFVVTHNGKLKDFTPVSQNGYGFEEELIRILQHSLLWIPAKKNGVLVNSWFTMTQIFHIDPEHE